MKILQWFKPLQEVRALLAEVRQIKAETDERAERLPKEIAEACQQLCWILLFVEKARKERKLQTMWHWHEVTEALPYLEEVQRLVDQKKAEDEKFKDGPQG